MSSRTIRIRHFILIMIMSSPSQLTMPAVIRKSSVNFIPILYNRFLTKAGTEAQ
jgi:hypothetical protein